MKNVLLIGIGGVYNYGCEAIVRGTVNILKTIYPDIHVSYASYNYEDDVRRLSDCDVQIVQRKRIGRWNWRNVLRKLLFHVNISYSLPYDTTDWLADYDTVFSIGGDIYTLSSNGTYNTTLPIFLEKCQSKGLKYVLWGASVGKFENNPCALAFYKEHLKKIDLIVARETVTMNYLKSIGVYDNVILAPDPAFFVECPRIEKKSNNKLTIGVNLSPLSALYQYQDLDIAIARQSEALCGLAKLLGCKYVFLPHVLSSYPYDNDMTYLKRISEKVTAVGVDVTLIDLDFGFIGLKDYLVKCDYVIAARMHCAVNAITMNVPTILLSYSEKAKGMAKFVYGTDETVISLTEFEDYQKIAQIVRKWNFQSQIEKIKSFQFNVLLQNI